MNASELSLPQLITNKDKFIVVIPAVLLWVHSRFNVGTSWWCTRRARSDAIKARLLQHVEGLLKKAVLQEEAARVAVGGTTIGIARLVQRLAENLATQGHSTAHQNT